MSKSSSSAVPFNMDVLSSFKPSKTLHYHADGASVSSMDFDDSGLWALTCSSDDESVQLYDCKTGKHHKTVYSKKYGCNLARFSHNAMNCVYASTKEDVAEINREAVAMGVWGAAPPGKKKRPPMLTADTIRYLSLHDNQYVRYFKGHKDKVTQLEVSPTDDTFISASVDHSVRLWDLRSPNCHGLLNIPGPALTTFDATGMIFVVASQSVETIAFYDVKSYDRAPFLSVPFKGTPPGVQWTAIEFSNQGKYVLLSTSGDTHYLFDGYNVALLAKLRGHAPLARHKTNITKHTAFTVDGRYVFGGSGDSKVHIWDLTALPEPGGTLMPAASLPCNRLPEVVGFSTKTMLFASAEKELTLWLPEKN